MYFIIFLHYNGRTFSKIISNGVFVKIKKHCFADLGKYCSFSFQIEIINYIILNIRINDCVKKHTIFSVFTTIFCDVSFSKILVLHTIITVSCSSLIGATYWKAKHGIQIR